MPSAAAQLPLFETDPPAPDAARAARARKAVFANLAVLRRAAPAAVAAPQFADWEASFLKLCELLPADESERARADLRAEVARLRAAA